MRLSYSSGLDRDIVVKSELQGRFDELRSWFNTPSLSEDLVEPMAVGYRNTDRVLDIMLSANVESVTFLGPYTGWYLISQSKLSLSLGTVTGYDNVYEPDKPVGLMNAVMRTTRDTITQFCLGYSHDGGLTWMVLTNLTARPFPANSYPMHAGLQANYMTGAPNYKPTNYVYSHHVQLLAGVGGDGDIPMAPDLTLGVFVNSNVMTTGFIKGFVEATFRLDQDTP